MKADPVSLSAQSCTRQARRDCDGNQQATIIAEGERGEQGGCCTSKSHTILPRSTSQGESVYLSLPLFQVRGKRTARIRGREKVGGRRVRENCKN